MAITRRLPLLLTFSIFFFLGTTVSATVYTLQNNCTYTVWPGNLNSTGDLLGDGGFVLNPGDSKQLVAPGKWSGRFWARTGCNFDAAGNGKCTTGDCGRGLRCSGAQGSPPVTLVEFTLSGDDGQNYYDVSLVDGYNVGARVEAQPTSFGHCQYADCTADLNGICPTELRVTDGAGKVVACKSPCVAFNTPEYCCTGDHSTPQTCQPTAYSKIFKTACPKAYSYVYDDETSTFSCADGGDYLITFCPTGSESSPPRYRSMLLQCTIN